MAVQHRNPAGEAGTDPLHGLRGEADLRHQKYGLLTLRHHLLHGAQIDLGFAAAGDTVQ